MDYNKAGGPRSCENNKAFSYKAAVYEEAGLQ